MSEEKIGMYSTEEIYEELATGFLHHSMVDAMYFKIKDLQQKVEQLEKELQTTANNCKQLENIRKESIRYIQNNQLYNFDYDKEELFEIVSDKVAKEYLLYILNKGDKNE